MLCVKKQKQSKRQDVNTKTCNNICLVIYFVTESVPQTLAVVLSIVLVFTFVAVIATALVMMRRRNPDW